MVSGYYPFDDTSKGALSSRTFDEAIVQGLRPRVVPECNEPLRELIEMCWAHEPEERPSVQAVIARLVQIGTHQQAVAEDVLEEVC